VTGSFLRARTVAKEGARAGDVAISSCSKGVEGVGDVPHPDLFLLLQHNMKINMEGVGDAGRRPCTEGSLSTTVQLGLCTYH
jgi:hypothetical protein